MRIVDRETFLALPAGTLFAKYEPCVFDALAIKGDSLDTDFLHQSIGDAIECTGSGDFGDKLEDAENDGVSLPMDFDRQGRDGCFDDGQLFAVFEPDDVRKLIVRLLSALTDSEVRRGG